MDNEHDLKNRAQKYDIIERPTTLRLGERMSHKGRTRLDGDDIELVDISLIDCWLIRERKVEGKEYIVEQQK